MELVINTIITGVTTFVLGAILGYIKSLKKKRSEYTEKEKEKNKSIENAVRALLKNELIKGYRLYKAKGEISILDKENMEHMRKEYKNLGGNGTVDDLWSDFLEIPTKVIEG